MEHIYTDFNTMLEAMMDFVSDTKHELVPCDSPKELKMGYMDIDAIREYEMFSIDIRNISKEDKNKWKFFTEKGREELTRLINSGRGAIE
jgi:hypothetical protein